MFCRAESTRECVERVDCVGILAIGSELVISVPLSPGNPIVGVLL